MRKGNRVLAGLTSASLTVVAVAATNLFSASAEPIPGTTCSLFPSSAIFNTDISTLPVNSKSALWMSNMTQNANIHPDLGTTAQQYGIPINVAPPPTTPTNLTPTFLFDSESDHPAEGYPIDQRTLIEGGPGASSGSDRHAVVEDKNLCKLYEIYNLQNFTNGTTPNAGSGAVWDLTKNAMRPNGWTSADAAGLPIMPLLLRPDEILAGSITHAIRFTTHCTSTYIWPASHQAGSCNSNFPPMGARFRLKASFDISSFSANTQTVLTAFKHYGLLLADNGSDWYFQGSTDDLWGTTLSPVVSELKTVPASAFEAVDESGLQGVANSYVASVPPAPAAPVAVAGEASATVYWTAPAADITSYTVRSLDGKTATVAGDTLSATIFGLTDGLRNNFTVTASNSIGPGPASTASNTVTPGLSAYQPLVPARILDTRFSSHLGPGGAINVQVTGQGGVPSTGVSAVVLNVTATDTTTPGYLTIWPAGTPRQTTSNLNWAAGQTVPNLVEVALGVGGQVSIFNGLGNADVVVDVEGYYATPTGSATSAGNYNAMVPNRVLDTRLGLGAGKAQLCAGQTINVTIAGAAGVPASGAEAVVLNVTATDTVVAPSAWTIWPTGTPMPTASNLNFVPGQTVANRVVVKLGAGGQVSIHDIAGHADVIADVNGWFSDGISTNTGKDFVGMSPVRIYDSRGTAKLNAASTLNLPFIAPAGPPPAAQPVAVVLNVTVTDATAASYLTVWPAGAARPNTSDLNFVAGQTVPNLVVVQLGTANQFSIYNGYGSVDVIVDVVGWYG